MVLSTFNLSPTLSPPFVPFTKLPVLPGAQQGQSSKRKTMDKCTPPFSQELGVTFSFRKQSELGQFLDGGGGGVSLQGHPKLMTLSLTPQNNRDLSAILFFLSLWGRCLESKVAEV